jgi:hypothetical protein
LGESERIPDDDTDLDDEQQRDQDDGERQGGLERGLAPVFPQGVAVGAGSTESSSLAKIASKNESSLPDWRAHKRNATAIAATTSSTSAYSATV